jgi:hypothetical protein
MGCWAVLDCAGNNKHGQAMWNCRCGCGLERVVRGGRLLGGRSISRGCEKISSLTGRKFGKLLVLQRLPASSARQSVWLCRCDCGEKGAVHGTNLLRNLVKSCGCLRREITQARMTGPSNPGWRGGITPEVQRIRNHRKTRNWKRSVFKRDNFTCQKCNVRGGRLEADRHPRPFRSLVVEITGLYGTANLHEKALEYAPMWDIDNGRTLCYECHGGKSNA